MTRTQKPHTRKPQTRTLDKKPAFLKAYIACADLTRAARAVKVDRSEHYRWLKTDKKYAAEFEAAREQAGQTLEDDAVHWARVGTFEQYTYQGRPQFAQRERIKCRLPDGREVYADEFTLEELAAMEVQSERTVQEDDPARPLGQFRRSEGLMGRLLGAFMPSRYAKKTEITGKDGGAIDTALTITFVKPK